MIEDLAELKKQLPALAQLLQVKGLVPVDASKGVRTTASNHRVALRVVRSDLLLRTSIEPKIMTRIAIMEIQY